MYIQYKKTMQELGYSLEKDEQLTEKLCLVFFSSPLRSCSTIETLNGLVLNNNINSQKSQVQKFSFIILFSQKVSKPVVRCCLKITLIVVLGLAPNKLVESKSILLVSQASTPIERVISNSGFSNFEKHTFLTIRGGAINHAWNPGAKYWSSKSSKSKSVNRPSMRRLFSTNPRGVYLRGSITGRAVPPMDANIPRGNRLTVRQAAKDNKSQSGKSFSKSKGLSSKRRHKIISSDTKSSDTKSFKSKVAKSKVAKSKVAKSKVAQPADAQVTSTQPADAQVTSPQPANAQVTSTQPANAQVTSTQPADAQVTSTQPADAQVTSTQPTNAQAASPQPTNPEFTRINKAREHLTTMEQAGPYVTKEGYVSEEGVKNGLTLSSKGKVEIQKTHERRTGPLIKSRFENEDESFFPVYGTQQVGKKNPRHLIEFAQKAGASSEQLANLFQKTQGEQTKTTINLLERLLGHNATELYSHVLAQGKEAIFVALNRGETGYIPANHWATFAKCLELGNFSAYITNYVGTPPQIENFDNSNGTNYTYENLLGDSITDTGRLFGAEPTPSPTPNPTTFAPTTKTMDQEL